MDRRDFLRGSIGASLLACAVGRVSAAPLGPDEVEALLAQRVGPSSDVAGIIAAIVDGDETRLVAFGSSGVPGLALAGDTVGQIGSITKVLTALLLAEMAARGEVALDDPVAEYLPPSLTLRERGRPVTLLDLATYTSGLPNMPANMPPRWWEHPNPYADYSEQDLAEFLSSYEPEYEPGARYRYANLGFGLLGVALARRGGMSYENLLVERVCEPLGLRDTRITLTDTMRRRLAQGHNQDLSPAPLWDMPTLTGGGGMRSTPNDLTAFLKASMGLAPTPLQAPIARLLETRRPTTVAGTDVGLGWFISSDSTDEIVWKSGLGGGFGSFIGFSTRSRRGVAVLSNAYGLVGIGLRLINPDFRPEGDLDSLLR